MKFMIRTALVVSTFTLLGAAPAQSSEGDPWLCREEYRQCMAAGYDADMCRDNYWLCMYGYVPVKAGGPSAAMDRRR
ncbi:MAG: hypothetical protein ACOY82_00180 [Pseudomonadota bacterium]